MKFVFGTWLSWADRILHRESRKGKESLKKSPPHSTLVASSCVESQGPVGRLTERSEKSEARRAESERSELRRKTPLFSSFLKFLWQLVLDKKAGITRLSWYHSTRLSWYSAVCDVHSWYVSSERQYRLWVQVYMCYL